MKDKNTLFFEVIRIAIGNQLCLSNTPSADEWGELYAMAKKQSLVGICFADRMCGEVADFTSFSFHAVKNLTTAEGGAITWKSIPGIDDEWLYKQYQLLSLH